MLEFHINEINNKVREYIFQHEIFHMINLVDESEKIYDNNQAEINFKYDITKISEVFKIFDLSDDFKNNFNLESDEYNILINASINETLTVRVLITRKE